MSKWKSWQLVFLGYLLLLNVVVLCSLAFFLLKNDFWKESHFAAAANQPLASTPVSATAIKTPWPTLTIDVSRQPTDQFEATPTPIPPVNIPPAPVPSKIEASGNPDGQETTMIDPVASNDSIELGSEFTPTATSIADSVSSGDQHPAVTQAAGAAVQLQAVATNTPHPPPTATDKPTPLPSPSATPTNTPVPTLTNTPQPTATSTSPPSPTLTRTPTYTPVPTATPTQTSTSTPRPTATRTPTPPPPPTSTFTPLPTKTSSPTATSTPKQTPTPVAVAALTADDPPENEIRAASIHPVSPDQAPANPAELVDAIPLTNDSIALTWSAIENTQQYRLYSDMGSGYGVYVYKANTSQPAYIDEMLRAGMTYSYRISRLEEEQELILAQVNTATFGNESSQGGLLASQPLPSATKIAPTLAPTALPPDVVLLGLLSDNNFTDNFNTLTIVGEVRNDSSLAVGQTEIAVTFYDAAGAIIGTANGETMLDVIPPTETSPFIITLSRPPGLASYSLRAIARPVTVELNSQLSVVQVKRYEDAAGFLHIKGIIENVGNSVAKRTKVAAVLYGRDGRVINIGFTYAVPPTLAPGEQGQYEVLFTYYPRYLTQVVIPFEE